jgi:hypothetical protein
MQLLTKHRDTIRVDDSDREGSMVTATTPTEYTARLVGFTPDGGPIIQFLENPGDIDADRGDILGRNAEGLLTVAFKRQMTVVTPRGNSDLEKASSSASEGLFRTPTEPRTAVVRIQSPGPPSPFSPYSNSQMSLSSSTTVMKVLSRQT